jgi:isopentenyl-diphosphate delta-isomerase
MHDGRREQVSFADESLILVDDSDLPIGYDSKRNVHAGAGALHRAFSIFLFRDPDTVLLHERSAEKPLWPGYWTNSCCSHPRRGECNRTATQRRLQQELGVQTELQFLYKFQYAARYGDAGSERELCAVYAGALAPTARPRVNASEIARWGWFDCGEVDAWLAREPELFTPWFKLEWARLRDDYRDAIAGLFREPSPGPVAAAG